jgi:RNase P subunit RPR2
MPRKSPKAKEIINSIALERMQRLLSLSEEALKSGDTKLSLRYSKLAKKIQAHYRVRPSLRYKVCKKCGTLLLPGITSSTRLSSKGHFIVVKCLVCGTELHKVYNK